jgi:hypothetical protein
MEPQIQQAIIRDTETRFAAMLKLALVCLGILFLLSGIVFIWILPVHGQSSVPSSLPGSPAKATSQLPQSGSLQISGTALANAQAELDVLRDQVGALRRQVEVEWDALKWLDTGQRTLLTIAGTFAILLGIGSWKILEDQRRGARDAIESEIATLKAQFSGAIEKADRALKDIQQTREELQEDFPMFGRMRRNFARIVQGIQSACRGLAPDDNAARRLHWEQKESILFLERAVADTLLLDMREHSEQLSEIYRLLGVFYGSRYAMLYEEAAIAAIKDAGSSARLEIRATVAASVPADYYERSQFYFGKAIDSSKQRSYLAYSHAGHFSMYYADHEKSRRAKQFLKAAAVCSPLKQRALVNLAILELAAFRDGEAALRALHDAEGRPEWEDTGTPSKPHVVDYMIACALVVRSESVVGQECDNLLDQAMARLERGVESADEWIKGTYFEGDYQNPGDREVYLQPLAKAERFASRFQVVEDKLREVSRAAANG